MNEALKEKIARAAKERDEITAAQQLNSLLQQPSNQPYDINVTQPEKVNIEPHQVQSQNTSIPKPSTSLDLKAKIEQAKNNRQTNTGTVVQDYIHQSSLPESQGTGFSINSLSALDRIEEDEIELPFDSLPINRTVDGPIENSSNSLRAMSQVLKGSSSVSNTTDLIDLRGMSIMSEEEVEEDDNFQINPKGSVSISVGIDADFNDDVPSWDDFKDLPKSNTNYDSGQIDMDAPQRFAGGLPIPVFKDIDPNNYDVSSLPEDFLNIAYDIMEFKPDLKIEKFDSPLEFGLEAFMSMNPTFAFTQAKMEYSITERIKVEHDDEYISLIMGIYNLRENQTYLNRKLQQDISIIEGMIQEEIRNYKKSAEDLIGNYNNQITQKQLVARQTADRIRGDASNLNNSITSATNRLFNEILAGVEKEYEPHLKSARALKKKIDSKKSELDAIIKSMSKSDLDEHRQNSVQLDGKSLEDIVELIEEVKAHLEDVDFKDVPFFKKYVTRFFDYFFVLTSESDGNVRALVFLVNILGFILFLKYLSPFFITFVLTSIALDAFQFFKLVDTNKSTVFLVDYSKNVESKIAKLKQNSLSEIENEYNPYTDIIYQIMDDKVTAVRKYADEVDSYNMSLLNTFITYEEVCESVYGKLDKIESNIEALRGDTISAIKELNDRVLGDIPELIDAKVNHLKKAPNEQIMEKNFRQSFVWDTDYKLGRYGVQIDDLQVGIDARTSLAEGSYVIIANDKDEKREALFKVFNLIAQQYNNILPEYLTVNYIDIADLGSDIMPMMSKNPIVSKTIIDGKELGDYMVKTREEMGKRYSEKVKSYKSATEYNLANKDNPDMDKIPYLASVFYGIDEGTLKSSGMRTIAKSSYMTGMPVILIFDLEEFQTFDKEGNPEIDKNIVKLMGDFDYRIEKGRFGWELFNVMRRDNKEGLIFEDNMGMEKFPLQFEEVEYMDKIGQVEGFISDSKMETIYFKDLLNLYAPELHKGNTLDGIEICMGYKEGDLTKPYTTVLGNDSVHALMGGATGSGKSNTINVMLACLTAKYPPEWLELYMIDFKVVEFKFFTNTINYPQFSRSLCRLPHTSLIAGTTDPEYSMSVFTRALKEMTRRLKMMANGITLNGRTETFKQASTWNKFVLDNNLREKGIPIIPRIMILIDEFQAMFKMEDKEKLAFIKLVITRLGKEARAAGIHMFFTSQSMDGTMDDDVKSQFKMRYCLAAPAPTSKSVIGNSQAATLTGKGYIILNESSERKEEDNVKIKVPFIPEDDLKDLMTRIEESASNLVQMSDYKLPFHKQEFYDEERSHDDIELDAFLSLPEIKKEREAVIIGNKVVFKTNPLPENFKMGYSDYENILVTGNSRQNAANILNTLMKNFSSKNDRDMVMLMNYDQTLDGLLRTEYADPDLLDFFNEQKQDLNGLLTSIIEDTMNVSLQGFVKYDELKPNLPPFNPETDARYYIFLTGLNKAPGFNADMHDNKHVEKLMWLLKHGPLFGVHFIFYWKEPFKQDRYLPLIAYRITAKIGADLSFSLFRNRDARDLMTSDGVNMGLFKSNIDDRMFKFKIYEFNYPKHLLIDSEMNFNANFGEGQVG